MLRHRLNDYIPHYISHPIEKLIKFLEQVLERSTFSMRSQK